MPAGQQLGSPIRATVLPVRPRPCWAGLCPGCGRIRPVRRRERRAEVAALLGLGRGRGAPVPSPVLGGQDQVCACVCVCMHTCVHVCARMCVPAEVSAPPWPGCTCCLHRRELMPSQPPHWCLPACAGTRAGPPPMPAQPAESPLPPAPAHCPAASTVSVQEVSSGAAPRRRVSADQHRGR